MQAPEELDLLTSTKSVPASDESRFVVAVGVSSAGSKGSMSLSQYHFAFVSCVAAASVP